MRRWSLPGSRALGAAARGDGDGDIEAPARRRASAAAAPAPPPAPPTAEELQAAETARLQALAEEELRLSIIYAQLSEVFGVDFGQPFGVLVDAEVETVATTRSDPSCPSEDGEGGEGGGTTGGDPASGDPASSGTAPRGSRRSENTHQLYALDPDTGLPLPEATPVGRERTMREEGRYYDCWQICMCFILIMFGVVIGSAAIIFLLFIILS